MKNNNSKNIKGQTSQPSPQKSKILKLTLQFGRVIFSLLGLICSFVFLYMLLTSSYTKIFDPSIINSCNSSYRYYLQKVSTLQKLVLILDAISILLFCLILFLSIATVFTGKNKKQENQKILLIVRMIFVYMVILSSGCLFGNCIQTILSLKNVYSCTTENMKYSVQYFYQNTQTLAVLSGLSLLAGIFTLFTHPCSIKIGQIIVQNTQDIKVNNEQNYKDKKNLDLQQKSVNELISPRTKQPMEINLGVKKPRIFNKQFLAQSKYGLSSVKAKQLQQSKNQTQSKQYYIDRSQVQVYKSAQPKQAAINNSNINFHIIQSQKADRRQYKNSSNHSSRDQLIKESVGEKQKDSQIQYHVHRSPRQIESNLVKFSDQKPPLQLGHYFPENQKVVFVYEKKENKNENIAKNQEKSQQEEKIQIKKKSQIFGTINTSNGVQLKPSRNIFI